MINKNYKYTYIEKCNGIFELIKVEVLKRDSKYSECVSQGHEESLYISNSKLFESVDDIEAYINLEF